MKNILLYLLLGMILPSNMIAQEILTLEEAQKITLSNNYGIQVAKNNVELATNNTDKSVNGYLPTVSANAGVNSNLGGSNQAFNNGQEVSTSNAFTWGANASVQANYTVIDKRRDLTLAQLKESLNLTNLQLRQTIEQNLLQVYSAYYQIARLSENRAVLQQALEISQERLRRAQYQLEGGQGSGLNVLNVKVDIQRDSVNLLNSQQQLANARRNLNFLMGRKTDEDFAIDTTVSYDNSLALEELLSTAQKENIGMKINRQNLTVNEMNLTLIEAEKKPTVTAGASYSYNYSDNPSQAFITSSNSRGWAANVGVNWTIFDGSRKVRRQNTMLNLTNQKIQLDQIEQQLERDLLNAWENYQNSLFILEVERGSVATNQENFARTQEQIRVGRLTSIEFRQAQLNLLNAQVNLNVAKYDAKVRELEVLQLAGQLMD